MVILSTSWGRAMSDAITWEYVHDGTLVLTAIVKDRNPFGNPWGAPFYHSRRYQGYERSEAIACFVDSLTRDGLDIIEE